LCRPAGSSGSAAGHARHAKIAEQNCAIGGEQYITGLDITVDNLVAVRKIQCMCERLRDVEYVGSWQ